MSIREKRKKVSVRAWCVVVEDRHVLYAGPTKEAASAADLAFMLAKKTNLKSDVLPCTITYSLPTKKKKV